MSKIFVVGNSGAFIELSEFPTSDIELMSAIVDVQQIDDINRLYDNKEFDKIITICKKNPKRIYTEDATKTTLFGRACEDGHVDLVREFLKIPGIDVSRGKINLINEEWNLSGFDLAVIEKQKEVIKLFLLNGQKIVYSEENKEMPIIKTYGLGNLLLSKDVNPLLSAMEQLSRPLNEAKKEVDALCIKVEEKIKDKDLAGVFEIAKEEADLFTWLIKVRPDLLVAKNNSDINFLQLAAYNKMDDLVKTLTQTGLFDLNATNKDGFTVIDFAMCDGSDTNGLVPYLIKHGANQSKCFDLYCQYYNNADHTKASLYESRAELFREALKQAKADVIDDVQEEGVDLSGVGDTSSFEHSY